MNPSLLHLKGLEREWREMLSVFHMITSLSDILTHISWLTGWRISAELGKKWDYVGLARCSCPSTAESEPKGQGEQGKHLTVLVSCCLRTLGLRDARGHGILLASLVFGWTHTLYEYNDGKKKVLLSSHVQDDLVPCCYSLWERSPKPPPGGRS